MIGGGLQRQTLDLALSRFCYGSSSAGNRLAVPDNGSSTMEGIWPQRFQYVDELRRMGAKIRVDATVAVVDGPCSLTGQR